MAIETEAVNLASSLERIVPDCIQENSVTGLQTLHLHQARYMFAAKEHLPCPERFVKKLVNLLQPGGRLICSAPTTPSVNVNPYHLNDFIERSFRHLFRAQGLVEIDCLNQIQPYSLGTLRNKNETRLKDLRTNLLGYYVTHPHRAIKRLWATIRFGFTNRYLTVAWKKPN